MIAGEAANMITCEAAGMIVLPNKPGNRGAIPELYLA
jgi:hypothetical protein